MSREPSLERLEHLDRHPIRTFFFDRHMTSPRMSEAAVLLGVFSIVAAATGYGHPAVLMFAVAAGWILRSNYRRFRERVRYALQEHSSSQTP